MKKLKNGDASKIEEVQKERYKKEHPVITCDKCDCKFEISKTDVYTKDKNKYVICPDCNEQYYLDPTETPSDYQEFQGTVWIDNNIAPFTLVNDPKLF